MRGHRQAPIGDLIDWLLNHQRQWTGFMVDDVRTREIVTAMKHAGLISLKTMWQNVDLHGLINRARRERRSRQLTGW